METITIKLEEAQHIIMQLQKLPFEGVADAILIIRGSMITADKEAKDKAQAKAAKKLSK